MEGGVSTMPVNEVMPIGIPNKAVARIPMSNAPGTFFITSTEVRMMPITPSKAVPWVMSPMLTKVAALSTMMPAFLSPMKAMKSPIPAPIARFIEAGIASTISVRTLVIVSNTKMMPSIRIAVRANCHE